MADTQPTPSVPESQVEKVAAKAAKIRNGGTATFAQLMSKPRRTLDFTVFTVDEDSNEVALKIKFRALPPKEYDDLVAAHPPTAKEKREGANFNGDTLPPALISAVSVEPKLTFEQAEEICTSSDWSAGEIGTLFMNAMRVCNAGLDVPFSARD